MQDKIEFTITQDDVNATWDKLGKLELLYEADKNTPLAKEYANSCLIATALRRLTGKVWEIDGANCYTTDTNADGETVRILYGLDTAGREAVITFDRASKEGGPVPQAVADLVGKKITVSNPWRYAQP